MPRSTGKETAIVGNQCVKWWNNYMESQYQKRTRWKRKMKKRIIGTKHAHSSCRRDRMRRCTHQDPRHFPRTSLPRLHASAGLVGTPSVLYLYCRLGGFPLPTQGCLGSLPPSAWSSCPFRYSLKLQRSSRDLILIPFFSSPLSILFLFPLPRPSSIPSLYFSA